MENAARYISYDPNPDTKRVAIELLEAASKGVASAVADIESCMNSKLEFGESQSNSGSET